MSPAGLIVLAVGLHAVLGVASVAFVMWLERRPRR